MVVAVIEPFVALGSGDHGSPPKPGDHHLSQSGVFRVARSGDTRVLGGLELGRRSNRLTSKSRAFAAMSAVGSGLSDGSTS